jgi:hypothetical protein
MRQISLIIGVLLLALALFYGLPTIGELRLLH